MEYMFTDENFEGEVLKAEGLVMVDFFATWCGPCKMMAPIVEELATEYEGKAKIGKLDVDEASATAAAYGIMSIPTVVFFKNGEKVDQFVGAKPKAEIAKILDANI
ncbi:MAG: thioredoxin [Lachnospiraceae bacterium]|nr:thioredoxin [Lachnospiraceae bacterium]